MRAPLLLCLALVGCGDTITNVFVVAAPDAAALDVRGADSESDTADSASPATDTIEPDSAAPDSAKPRVDTGPLCCGSACAFCESARVCAQGPGFVNGKCACTSFPTTCQTRNGVEQDHAYDCGLEWVPLEFDCKGIGNGLWCCP
jgi:hypothetical protein